MLTLRQVVKNSRVNNNSHIIDGDCTARLLRKVCRLWLNVVDLNVHLETFKTTIFTAETVFQNKPRQEVPLIL